MSGEPWWFNDSASDRVVWRFSGFDSAGVMIDFEFAGPNAASATIAFKPYCLIGRDPARCHVVIVDPTVSRLHAEIHYFPGHGVKIRDLGSSNGTFVNGERVHDDFLPIGMRSVIALGALKLDVSIKR
ncbi:MULTISPECIES: FHA domain-containing protein [Rhodomicrobium]|uniref:FHA domain-containing protein n=1 Tax=Rhodomicrobium TaxID=1068 RepID=UPI000B4A76C7|nr:MULTISPECIES: FHA domain-containing protein [Rhodomicrobium]